ncbi:MAG: aminotransferase class V-fold PLP-dependent enzyme, partial [Lysobacterales bacterium]
AIADALAEINRERSDGQRILLVVDGVHGIGAVDETIAQMGCDFFAAGTHKWMFAPRGTGLVWANAANWALLRPTIPSFSSESAYEAWLKGEALTSPNTADRVSPGGFHAYEHQWAMGAAFRMHMEMGRARVAERIRVMNDQCKRELARISGLRLRTPLDPALSAGITCFELDGKKPEDVVKALLAKNVIASTSPYAVTYVRLAPSLVNTPEQVDAAVRAVRQIAAS